MPYVKNWQHQITPEDIVHVEIQREGPTLSGFAISYRARIQGQWREIIRFDTAHGGLHVHRFYETTTGARTLREGRYRNRAPLQAAFRAAWEETTQNWARFRDRFERRLRRSRHGEPGPSLEDHPA